MEHAILEVVKELNPATDDVPRRCREVFEAEELPALLLEKCLKRETRRVSSLRDTPLIYGRFTYVFDKWNDVEAWTFAGDNVSIKTRNGDIPGDSIFEYCKRGQARGD